MAKKINDIDLNEGWIRSAWRPAMAWQYFVVCLFDFLFAPILSAFYAGYTGTELITWEPLTLSNGGLYHLAMGAIVGVTSWSRGREKIQRMLLDGTMEQVENETTSQEVFSENPPNYDSDLEEETPVRSRRSRKRR